MAVDRDHSETIDFEEFIDAYGMLSGSAPGRFAGSVSKIDFQIRFLSYEIMFFQFEIRFSYVEIRFVYVDIWFSHVEISFSHIEIHF